METRKIKDKRRKKSWFIIIGSLIIVLGFSLLSFDFIKPYVDENTEEKSLEQFYIKEEQIIDKNDKTTSDEVEKEKKPKVKYDYIAVLKIPKINLEKGLVEKSSKYNNINYGVQILKESDSPDVINGNVILAAHSGTANISYFRNLDKLDLGDDAIIYYQGNTYNYKVVKKYDADKTGKINIKRDRNTSTLTLITCRHNTDKQIVIILELQNQ
jgi:LPXTG-site transpeptidase (sortase) family protein